MRRTSIALLSVVLLAALQVVLLRTPTALVPIDGGRPASVELDVQGGRVPSQAVLRSRAALGQLRLVPVGQVLDADPVVGPRRASGARTRRAVPRSPQPATYKLALPGYRPFGLLDTRP